MAALYTDRLNGLSGDLAVKAPCRVATTANITLSGTQTIDGVAVVADDRVLVKSQTSSVDNGIWICGSGAWTRSLDFNGSRDCVGGTMVLVVQGSTNSNSYWRVDGIGAKTPATDAITFSAAFVDDSATATFLQSGASSEPRTMQDKGREWVTPEDKGAAGDGVTDDTAAVQAAIDEHSHVRFPEGKTYLVSTITVPSNRTLSGRGTLKLKANTNNWVIQNSDVSAGNTNIRIYDLTIDGNKANQSGSSLLYGVYFARVTDSIIEGLKINDCKEDAILLGSSAVGQKCERVKVLKNICTNNGRNGISIVAGDDCEVDGNTVVGCAGSSATENAGIDIEADNAGVSVSRNKITNNTVRNVGSAAKAGRGITCVNAVGGTMTDNNISNNSIYNCGACGIELQDLSFVTANDNDIIGCGMDISQVFHALYVNNCDDATVNNNRIRGQGNATVLSGSAIFLNLSDRATINGNKCLSNYGQGIDVRGSRNGAIIGNLCVNNGVGSTTAPAINLQTASAIVPTGWVISGNRCYDTAGGAGSQAYGLSLTNATACKVNDNNFAGNRTAGMTESGTDNDIRSNYGYDPLGYWAGAPAVPATTVAATNTSNHPCMVYIEGGTDVLIAVGGTSVHAAAAATPFPVSVEPGQTITPTYTVAPTWRWFRA